MATTVTNLGGTLYRCAMAQNDECEVLFAREVFFGAGGGPPRWQRSVAADVEVLYTLYAGAVRQTTRNDADWSGHPEAGTGAVETVPIAGLRFKNTNAASRQVIIDTCGDVPTDL